MTSPANEKTIYWQSILEKWKNSGLSQMAFSMHEGIDSRRLAYWKKALIARGLFTEKPTADMFCVSERELAWLLESLDFTNVQVHKELKFIKTY